MLFSHPKGLCQSGQISLFIRGSVLVPRKLPHAPFQAVVRSLPGGVGPPFFGAPETTTTKVSKFVQN